MYVRSLHGSREMSGLAIRSSEQRVRSGKARSRTNEWRAVVRNLRPRLAG